MNLENQQKINIIIRPKTSCLRIIIVLFFFVLFGVGGVLTGFTQGACFPIVIVAFVGFVVYGCCASVRCSRPCVKYNSVNKDLEINSTK